MCPSYTRPDRPRVLFAGSRLHAGPTAAVLGQRVAAPSAVGSFVRSFG